MELYKLANICHIKSGKRIPLGMDFATNETEHPYIRARDIKNGIVDTSNLVYIDDEVYSKIKKHIINNGDIAITIVGASVGDTAYANDNVDGYNLTENAVRLTSFCKYVNGKYLFYMLSQKQYHEYMQTIAGGAAQPKLGIYKIERIKVLLPNIKQQNFVASILSTYDDLIEKNNRKIEILQEQAQEIYKEWFVRFRFPGHQTAKFENGLPKGWKLMRVDALGEIVGGGTPSTSNDEYWGGSIPWLTPADLSDNTRVFISSGSCNISALGLRQSSTRMLPKNSVLLSSRAPVGYVAIAANPICTNQGFKSVICLDEIITPFYLYYYFKENRELLENYATGSTFPELSASRLKKIKILVPDINIQDQFSSAIKPILLTANNIEERNFLLAKQRDLLLPRLMSSKLEVQ